MTAHDELRKRTQAVIEYSEATGNEDWFKADELRAVTKLPEAIAQADAEFIAAANPQTILALLDELEQYKQDAERYLAFFSAGLPITFLGEDYRTKAELDAAIDAAIKAEGKV